MNMGADSKGQAVSNKKRDKDISLGQKKTNVWSSTVQPPRRPPQPWPTRTNLCLPLPLKTRLLRFDPIGNPRRSTLENSSVVLFHFFNFLALAITPLSFFITIHNPHLFLFLFFFYSSSPSSPFTLSFPISFTLAEFSFLVTLILLPLSFTTSFLFLVLTLLLFFNPHRIITLNNHDDRSDFPAQSCPQRPQASPLRDCLGGCKQG